MLRGASIVSQDPELLAKVRAEIDQVMGPIAEQARAPVRSQKLELVRLCLAESLRLYPEPILIRRCLEDVPLPRGG